MGLAGGIVRKVFSKSLCSSAGGRGHSVRLFFFLLSPSPASPSSRHQMCLWGTLFLVGSSALVVQYRKKRITLDT
uniref:Uncharacterized protein n=1 Tax=Arundo donax TaxID=35708 RepID=A0A0A9CZT7_ARUDO